MSPLLPRPDALPIPGPAWLFQVLLLATFLVHVVAMNAILGGSFLVAIGASRGGDGGRLVAARLAGALPPLFALTVTFGVAPLLFLQVLYGHLFYSSTILIAWPWLGIVGLVIAAYYGAYALAFRRSGAGMPSAGLAWAIFAILATVAFIQVTAATLGVTPDRLRAMYFADPTGMNANLSSAELLPRYAHMVLGAIAIAGIGAALAARTWAGSAEPPARAAAARFGLRAFLYATAPQLGVGTLFLVAQPPHVRASLMGGSALGTALFAVGFLLTLHLVGAAWRAARAADPLERVPAIGAAALVVLADMLLLRDHVRRAALAPHFDALGLAAAPQWDVLAVFLVTFAIGAGVVAWLWRAWGEAARI